MPKSSQSATAANTLKWDQHHPARILLLEELKNGKIPLDEDEMGNAEVYYTYSSTFEFQMKGMEYGPTFIRRLRALRKQVKDENGPKPLEWNEDHPARKLLYDELVAGRIPLDPNEMGPAEVYYNYSGTIEFQIEGMDFDQTFRNRLRDLRKQVDRDKGRANEDEIALRIAFRNHPPPTHNHRGEPQWNGSAAQRLLKEDMELEKHLVMKPSELRMTRVEYQAYSKDTFRWKIQQEIKTKKYKYTLEYRAQTKLRKHLKEIGITDLK